MAHTTTSHYRSAAMATPDSSDQPAQRGEDLAAERRAKVDRLRAGGVDPYPVGVDVTTDLAALVEAWGDRLEPGEESTETAAVGGRMVLRRGHGKLVFLVLREAASELQVMCQLDVLGEEAMARVLDLDVGDWVAASGPVVRTRRGELSIQATAVTLIGKSLQPLPDKWHGLRDVETRYRRRWVDLTVNPEARAVFTARSRTLAALRAELLDRGYVEEETPVLHPIPGGALATPFVTHHRALDVDLYLRIAPELYLKRLVAGGLPRVFEIARVFRNEGLSPRHNPEFTMLESYEAYADYYDVMDLVEALLRRAALEATGATTVTYGGRGVDLGSPFARRPLLELVQEAAGVELGYDDERAAWLAVCKRHDVHTEPSWGVGKLVLEVYEKLVEPNLWEPTFVLDYPVEVSPLARTHRSDPHVTERFELIVTGRELANAFSELTDPQEQRRRFEAQARARAAGDAEAMVVDEDYLAAMEFGMPPMGGLGIGIDRLVMLLADVQSIRDVILFPTLRPESS